VKLWGGRFETGPSEVFERFSGSLHFDRKLIDADIQGSKAWARSLERVGILAAEEDLSALAPDIAARASAGRIESMPYRSRNDLERSGRELYASIRRLDATGVSKILAIGVGSDGLARAIHDRLKRAADGRIRTIVQD